MGNLIACLQNKDDLITGKPVDNADIIYAEKVLKIEFSDEYKEILKVYGFICVDGHEITGITNSKRLNVCDVTIKERNNTKGNMDWLYVIEQTHIDGIVIWQSRTGEVYQTVEDSRPEKIANNIFEYLML